VMKDAYSFHAALTSLEQTYQTMHDTYSRIFTRLGLKFRAVAADTGAIGGSGSHEFHVLADSGEDAIAFCPDSDYAANIELAEALPPAKSPPTSPVALQKIATPSKTSCEEVAAFLKVPIEQTVKTLAVMANGEMVLLLLRGDHQLNEVKAGKLAGLGDFRLASAEEILAKMGCRPGYLGPVRSDLLIIADRTVAEMSNFVCGANEADYHYSGTNWERDVKFSLVADIRNVVAGDPSPDGKGQLEICRGIEVGHIFQLRTKYSEAMKATYLDESGQAQAMEMGCYGIGVSRIVAAAIEQNHDSRGIIFPAALAPFQLAIVPIGMKKSAEVQATVEQLYRDLTEAGVEVLLDDRDERPGVMFADMELIGIPHRIVIGERGLKEGNIEYQGRTDEKSQLVPLKNAGDFVKSKLCGK